MFLLNFLALPILPMSTQKKSQIKNLTKCMTYFCMIKISSYFDVSLD